MKKLLQPSLAEVANTRALTDDWYGVSDGGRMLGQQGSETSTAPGMTTYWTLVMLARYGCYKEDTKRTTISLIFPSGVNMNLLLDGTKITFGYSFDPWLEFIKLVHGQIMNQITTEACHAFTCQRTV